MDAYPRNWMTLKFGGAGGVVNEVNLKQTRVQIKGIPLMLWRYFVMRRQGVVIYLR